jgi:hypothetical protein
MTNFNETIEMLQREFSGFAVRSFFFAGGTVMIGIFPYHFVCRDWYEKATVVSGVAYLKYVPMSEAESPAVRECWQQANGCHGDCLDCVCDQNIWLICPSSKALSRRRLRLSVLSKFVGLHALPGDSQWRRPFFGLISLPGACKARIGLLVFQFRIPPIWRLRQFL